MKTNEIIVIRTCREKGTKEEVSFEYAIKRLNGYWSERDSIWTDIQNSLLKGEELFTPFAIYQVKSEK